MPYEEKVAFLLDDVSYWTHKITEVWNPATPLYVRVRPSGGHLFSASLKSGMRFQIGVEENMVDLCGLWADGECVIWDSLIGPCMDRVKPGSASTRRDQMRNLVRRNLYLMEVNVHASDEEKQGWDQEWAVGRVDQG